MAKHKLKKKFKIIFYLIFVICIISLIAFLSILILHEDKKEIDFDKSSTTTKYIDDTTSAKLTLVGDFLFEQPFYDAYKSGDDLNVYFQKVKNYFTNDDLSIGNMEVVIGNDSLTSSGTGYNFCAPSYIGDLVSSLDLEVLSTANNHAYDRGKAGIDSTIDYFKNNTDILTVGTNKNKEDINEKKILEINNIKFGFLAYTYGTNIKPDTNNRAYINYFRDITTKTMTEEYKNKITNDINNLRSSVDVLIVIMHWGTEFTYTPTKEQMEIASFLNSLNVDIIMGSHAHSIQPIKWIGNEHKTLVYYSMGNFVSADDDISRTGETFDNAYQVGLLSTLKVTKQKNNITISDITTEPIINYYDTNLRHFELVPLNQYTSDYEKKHYRYSHNFNRKFITDMYENVIDSSFR